MRAEAAPACGSSPSWKSWFALLRCLVLCWLLSLYPGSVSAASLTIITHGLNSNIDDWVLSMAQKIPRYNTFPGTNFSCYELYFTNINTTYSLTWRRLAGVAASDSGEIVVKLDWRQLANNSYSTYQVAAMVVPHLLERGFITEWPGHALAELPMHLIGHSRGGSLICEMSNLLGTNGVWVDQLTTLDPHPMNNDGFKDTIFGYTVVDAAARTYENVLFHDNYFQKIDSLFNGEAIPGAYTRQLTNLDGGYSGIGGAHSDVHLWYHGTVDWQVPATDSVSSITATERQNWWTEFENGGTNTGYLYSRIGRGDRLSTNQPAGAGRIRDGYNQRWDLGAGTVNNRVILATNRGDWANFITIEQATNLVAFGQTDVVRFAYQWARPASSNAVVAFYLDDDSNPFNGNERLLGQSIVGGTGADAINPLSVGLPVDSSNTAPGEHLAFAKITANGQSRYLYAPETLTVMSSFAPPALRIGAVTANQATLLVDAIVGQRIVIETSPDLRGWSPVATNWIAQTPWSYSEPGTIAAQKFYRAVVR